jgi:energy-coupling factor transporter ATP-binding protein EcfA2
MNSVVTWFKQLGFKENPLDVRPNPDLIGLEAQEKQVINHILKEEICFLNGLTGSGKTSLLAKIQKTLKGHKFIYLDAQDLPPDFNLEQELMKKRNFFDRISLRRFPKQKPVLIIDEFQDTDKNIVLEARSKWENPNDKKIKSIVFAQISKQLKNVTPSFKERLGNRIVVLPTLDDDDMKEILRRRLYNKKTGINYYSKLHNEAINLLVACADGNPRRLLEYTDMIFDFHHNKFSNNNPIYKKPNYLVTYFGAKEILALNKVNVDAYKYLEKKAGKKRIGMFEKTFDEQERKYLIYLMTGPKTYDEVARHFRKPKKEVLKVMKRLWDKDAIVDAGRKDRKKRVQASPHVKRLSVKV